MSRGKLIHSRLAATPELPDHRVRAVRAREPGGGAGQGASRQYERGIETQFLVGTSAGALNAALWPLAHKRQQLGRIKRDLRREDVFPVSLTALVGGVSGRHDHLIPDRGLRLLVRRHREFDDLADAPIPLHVVAFDLTEGREVLLCEGPAVEPIAASASIPGIFPPVERGNDDWSTAARSTTHRFLTRPPSAPKGSTCCRRSSPASRPVDRRRARSTAIYAVGLLISSRLESDIAQYSRDLEIVVMPARTRRRYSRRASSMRAR
jgi:NTE family protein